ncbi:hypothetical protein ATANTOWER_026692 [Ataeniobius toweri]|uniref:Uncharacterized protein n=1 Tax=Ataeniobius toweri TaxID=208326 RepID=A0ABU7BID2_9TELE|nr:hypothetical protein [Ataeniobius toweri]
MYSTVKQACVAAVISLTHLEKEWRIVKGSVVGVMSTERALTQPAPVLSTLLPARIWPALMKRPVKEGMSSLPCSTPIRLSAYLSDYFSHSKTVSLFKQHNVPFMIFNQVHLLQYKNHHSVCFQSPGHTTRFNSKHKF